MRLPELHQRVTDLILDTDRVITPTHITDALRQALAAYSNDRPLTRVEDVESGGAYELAIPAAWQANKSQIVSLEYPVGNVPAAIYSSSCATIYQALDGPVLHLNFLPQSGEPVRVRFTAQHVANDTEVTIFGGDEYAVCCMAASYCCGQLAGYYAQETSSSMGASTVDHSSKTERWLRREKELRATYQREIGASDKTTTPAAGSYANAKAPSDRWWP
jgi:hypothetical protein